jgi:ABC-type lipoprotein release transport system permease subunit
VTVVLAGALLAFVIFSWDRAAGLSAEERGEIAILKAIGWETSDVLLLKLWEGAAISLTAFLAGTILAYAHVFLASGWLFARVIQGWSVLYPPLRPVPAVSPFELATLFALTVLPYTAATLLPSWRAATVAPDAILRA